jgi:transcriptional regulator with XRE-family HTH domain
MAHRAAAAGTPISRTTLGDYANGKQTSVPDEDVRRALAAALDVSFEVLTAAALETVAPTLAGDGRTAYRAEAWLKLTAGRSDQQVEHLLAVVEAVLRAFPDRAVTDRLDPQEGTGRALR